jgi:hypothetical protein
MHVKESSPADHSSIGPHERRKKPRQMAKGVIVFNLRQADSSNILGFLLDVSFSGFRAAHRFKELSPGQEIAFRYGVTAGLARVIWTRIMDESVESGFLVLDNKSE